MNERNLLIAWVFGCIGMLMLVIFITLDREPYKILPTEKYKVIRDKSLCFVLIYGETNRFESCEEFRGWK